MPFSVKSNRRLTKKLFSKPKHKQRWQVKQPARNWLELPSDVMANILHRLGAVEILGSAQHVCTAWYRICKDPAIWREIDLSNSGDLHGLPFNLEKMCMHAVDRSEGHLVDINIEYFGTDELLQYVANRSNQLRRLQIARCFGCVYQAMPEALSKLPLLEELNLYFTNISKEAIEVAGRCCRLLKSMKLNENATRNPYMDSDEEARECFNESAIAIGENLHELRHLQLIGNSMSNIGLKAILDGCPHLESLDLRCCPNVKLDGDLGKRCSAQIKNLRLPKDSLEGYEWEAEIIDEDYVAGFSDLDINSDYEDDYFDGYFDYDDFFSFDDFTKYEDLNNSVWDD